MIQAILAMERGRIERIGAYIYGQYTPNYPDEGGYGAEDDQRTCTL